MSEVSGEQRAEGRGELRQQEPAASEAEAQTTKPRGCAEGSGKSAPQRDFEGGFQNEFGDGLVSRSHGGAVNRSIRAQGFESQADRRESRAGGL